MSQGNGGRDIEVTPPIMFQITVTADGRVTWVQPQGTDDVYFRGMMDKCREAVLAQIADSGRSKFALL